MDQQQYIGVCQQKQLEQYIMQCVFIHYWISKHAHPKHFHRITLGWKGFPVSPDPTFLGKNTLGLTNGLAPCPNKTQSVQCCGIYHFPEEIIPMALCSYCLNTRTQQKVSLKPSFSKAEHVLFSQPFLKGQTAQSFNHLCGPSSAGPYFPHRSDQNQTEYSRCGPTTTEQSGIMTITYSQVLDLCLCRIS